MAKKNSKSMKKIVKIIKNAYFSDRLFGRSHGGDAPGAYVEGMVGATVGWGQH